MCIRDRLWGAQALTENSVNDYDSMVETALRESRPLLSASSGDSLLILSGVPFGQSGGTNNILVATFA